jgi:carboxymethylenebutenolidase
MSQLEQRIAEEAAAAYKAGRITYRDFIHKLTVVTGSVMASLALAFTMGCAADVATSTQVATLSQQATATATAPPAGSPTATAAGQGGTVTPGDSAIQASDVRFENDGVELLGYLAQPDAPGPHPAVLVIHENRGLLPHFPDVARRLAEEGYVALALDLTSREGGTAALGPGAQAALSSISREDLVEDMNGAVRYLQGLPTVNPQAIGTMGFCFGGGMVWLLCTSNQDIKAAVPFYGSRPPLEDVPQIRAAVLGIYGANDNRINSGVLELQAALEEHGVTHEIITYDGAGHAFFNDTGGAYNAEAAEAAWRETLRWFEQHIQP